MLELVDVSKSYESPGGAEPLSVLKGITFKLEKGESVAVVGPSGSGKSTLLNIIGGLDRPSTGRVLFEGRDLAELDDTELAHVRNQDIGVVFQLHHLLAQCTVIENVLIPTLVEKGRTSKKEVEARAIDLLRLVGLGEHILHRPGELSGGQRQRVAVVRALINRPGLLLADEPTGSLDADSSQNISDLLVELNRREKVAMIVVTHSQALAERIGRVMELDRGRLKNRSGE
ncbi:MAG: ABC transporter ATP-binding protein [Sedimentisphaerales bacterium]|nr:ABC transporter ATP-binding protein [Sedimentisphaerales bacterium]